MCVYCFSPHFFLSLPVSQGHFVRSLGNAGDKGTETEVVLLEHDVPHQDFSQSVLSFLPQMPWAITPEVTPRCGRHLGSIAPQKWWP